MTGAEAQACRLSLFLTIEEMAEAFEVSTRTVRRWEAGGVDGAAEMALRLARRLHTAHMAWRKGEVTIRLTRTGVEMEKPWW